jgi:hypothetical protein
MLCESMRGMVETLDKLKSCFTIVRVKVQIRKNPLDEGNKCLLVNLIVKDPDVKPVKYE